MLIRHCALCGREIKPSLPYSPTYVYYQKKWYCTDCFTTITTPRVLKNDWFEKTKIFVTQEVSKDNLYNYFIKHYHLSYVPQYIFKRLDEIYKGTYKGLAQPIPPHELLDIIERKENTIDSWIRQKNIKNDTSKITAALTIACNSYKSYKEWQSRIRAEQEEAKEDARERQGHSYKLKGYVPPNEPEKENMFIDFDDEEEE